MRKIFILVAVLVFAACGYADAQMRLHGLQRGHVSGAGDPLRMTTTGGGVTGGGACTTITVEYWQTFEFDDAAPISDTTALAANDNNAGGNYGVSDTNSLMSTSTSGQKNLVSCPGGVADTGTRGIAKSNNNAANASYYYYNFAAGHDNVRIGFWYKTVAVSSSYQHIFSYGSGGPEVRIRQEDAGGGIYIDSADPDTTNITGIAANTWYWIAINRVRNATSKIRVYNEAGAQVGVDSTYTAPDDALAYYELGSGQSGTQAATTQYYDNVIIDWSSSTDPLGP